MSEIEDVPFGKEWLAKIITALKIPIDLAGEPKAIDNIQAIEIEFITHQFGTIHMQCNDKWQDYVCLNLNLKSLKDALEFPYWAQRISLRLADGEFMIAHYQIAADGTFGSRLLSILNFAEIEQLEKVLNDDALRILANGQMKRR